MLVRAGIKFRNKKKSLHGIPAYNGPFRAMGVPLNLTSVCPSARPYVSTANHIMTALRKRGSHLSSSCGHKDPRGSDMSHQHTSLEVMKMNLQGHI
jgi:hypothetical protein